MTGFCLRGALSIRHVAHEGDNVLLDDEVDLSDAIQRLAPEIARSESDNYGYERSYYGRYVINFERVPDLPTNDEKENT